MEAADGFEPSNKGFAVKIGDITIYNYIPNIPVLSQLYAIIIIFHLSKIVPFYQDFGTRWALGSLIYFQFFIKQTQYI